MPLESRRSATSRPRQSGAGPVLGQTAAPAFTLDRRSVVASGRCRHDGAPSHHPARRSAIWSTPSPVYEANSTKARIQAGMSAGDREDTRPASLSTTTSLSSYKPPALRTSCATLAQDVIRTPRTTPALMST